jgi:hypothetical protein
MFLTSMLLELAKPELPYKVRSTTTGTTEVYPVSETQFSACKPVEMMEKAK